MANTIGNIKSGLNTVIELIKANTGAITDDDVKDISAKFAVLETELRNHKMLGSSGSNAVAAHNKVDGISDFFNTVGEGVVEAQRRLDRDSLAYSAARLPTAVPASFRIPRVSAEIQFALSVSDSRKLDFLVYGTEKEKKELHQNKVSFEIVAAPPPLEVGTKFDSPIKIDTLLLALPDRARAIDRLEKLRQLEDIPLKVRNALKAFDVVTRPDHVLIFRYREIKPKQAVEPRGSERCVLVDVARSDDANTPALDIEIHGISIPFNENASADELTVEEVLGGDAGDSVVRVQEWFVAQVLLDLADWQETFLQGLRRDTPQ